MKFKEHLILEEKSPATVEAVQNGEAVVSLKNKSRTVFIVRVLRQKLLNYAKRHNITRIYIISTGTEHRKRMENMRLII